MRITTGRLSTLAASWTSSVDKHSVAGEAPVRLCNYTDVYKNERISGDLDFMRATASDEQISRFRIRRGDTLITKDSETADDIGVPTFVDYEAPDLVCGYHLAIIRPDPLTTDPRFLYWAMSSRFVSEQWAVLAAGVTRVGLRRADISRVSVPIMALDQQRAIAAYLDRETARIDALITKQKSLIAALGERRQALVERAITGASLRAPTRPTGLEWCPDVPTTWQVGNIRRFASMKTGHTPRRSTDEYWIDCTIPWVTLADVWQLRNRRSLYLAQSTDTAISEAGLANSAAELLPAGTVVLSRTASVGFSGIMPVAMATSQDYWNWICGPQLSPEYLVWVFRAMKREFSRLMIGSTHKTIYQHVAAGLQIPVPTLEEQQRIVSDLSSQTARIDSLVDKAEALIALATERRAALITASVTGQFHVGAA